MIELRRVNLTTVDGPATAIVELVMQALPPPDVAVTGKKKNRVKKEKTMDNASM